MSDLTTRAKAIHAKADEIAKQAGPLARTLYLNAAANRSVLDQARCAEMDSADARAARAEIRRARKAGLELLHLVELRQRGRHAEADLFERANQHLLRDQFAAFEATADPEPEPEATPLFPEPPQAA